MSQAKTNEGSSEIWQGLQNAICAGIFASLSSVCGKLMSTYDTLPVKITCIAGIVACTILMIGFMTRSMKYLTTLTATVTNTASNFIITVRERFLNSPFLHYIAGTLFLLGFWRAINDKMVHRFQPNCNRCMSNFERRGFE